MPDKLKDLIEELALANRILANECVLDAFGQPIPGLYAAGECGSVFGHLYMSGGNLAECFIGGRIAGRNAARSVASDSARALARQE